MGAMGIVFCTLSVSWVLWAHCTLHLVPCTMPLFKELRTQPANAHNVLHPVSALGAMGAQGLGGGPSLAATALFNNPLML